MEFLIVLTLSKPCSGGFRQATLIRTITADPGSTRSGLLSWALDQAGPELQGANVLFFSAEPNALPATLKAVQG
ncbi:MULTISPECIES: hypothetical protein [Streptosporangium]|uniref:Uncharacterized protein n=1 Tax=Streptosporangium brasiliense TaxID=47480 RepID=A0ABT9RMH6_9ACTN|nr:hypothetical protein [Streptosporangium brasiliense]MDP9870480.1 hypothetical protein [Streptosporangium brasiliense]